jgi:hypothetical protein
MSSTADSGSRALSVARVLAAFLLAMLAVVPTADARQTRPQVDVLVVDSVTQAPIGQIEVQAYRQTDAVLVASASTASTGRVRLGPLPKGTYTILAARPGNGGSVLTNVVLPTPRGQTVLIAVDAGSDPWLGSAPLPAGMLAVQVRTENTGVAPAPDNSRPIILASVTLTPEIPGQPTRVARGDRNGWVVFRDVLPGLYRLRGQAQNGGAVFADQLVVTFNAGAGQRVTLPLEQTNAAPPAPEPAGPGAIDGLVLGFDGTPVANAPVRLFLGTSSRIIGTATSNDRGQFVIANLAPGSYRVDALIGSRRSSTRIAVTSNAASSALLRAGSPPPSPRLGSITGNVIAGFLRQYVELLPGATVRLTALFPGGPTGEAVADDISQFGFGGLPAGRYRVTATKANVGTADLTIDLRAGQARLNNAVFIVDANPAALAPAGVLEGTVLTSAAGGPNRTPGARIEIFGSTGGEPIAETVSGSRGEFRFDGLPAGRLRMVVTFRGSRTFTFDMPAANGRRIWPLLSGR